MAQTTAFGLRVGEHLYAALPFVELGAESAGFLPGQIYSYNLTITPDGAPQTLTPLGITASRTLDGAR